jgi:hypothetical protein
MLKLSFGEIDYVEHRAQIEDSSTTYLSRVQDKLRKGYKDLMPVALSADLGELLRQLDSAA